MNVAKLHARAVHARIWHICTQNFSSFLRQVWNNNNSNNNRSVRVRTMYPKVTRNSAYNAVGLP